jgi:hypothetical protein
MHVPTTSLQQSLLCLVQVVISFAKHFQRMLRLIQVVKFISWTFPAYMKRDRIYM